MPTYLIKTLFTLEIFNIPDGGKGNQYFQEIDFGLKYITKSEIEQARYS